MEQEVADVQTAAAVVVVVVVVACQGKVVHMQLVALC